MERTAQDRAWMQYAIQLAYMAEQSGEVPIGAVVVHQQSILGRGWNQVIQRSDPSAHAEMIALRNAGMHIGNYRLPANTTLYVTLEPCGMCLYTLLNARIQRIVYGAKNPRTGAIDSCRLRFASLHYTPKLSVTSGLSAPFISSHLTAFFQKKRQISCKNRKCRIDAF